MRVGLALNVVAAAGLFPMIAFELATPVTFMFPLFIFAIGNGLTVPSGLAGSLSEVDRPFAGSASALTGFVQMSLSAVAADMIGRMAFETPMPLAAMMGGAAFMALVAYSTLPRRHRSAAPD